MLSAAELLVGIRRIIRLYEDTVRPVCDTYQITQIETDILAFLHNNPGKDTAKDIVELRMLQKGNVSQAVERLIQKGILSRRQDEKDRRRIHLSLTPSGTEIADAILTARKQFLSRLFKDFSEKELLLYLKLNQKLFANAAGNGDSRDC
ncbi:MAG TPA: MarR family transcriptional regulator [Candidatus Lachnoclostridium pullistercoris]|uniref:MarR family transcriptional regulator n=1 Tax=Candidatus Lachnoclostridium pullistercoris TaxID=2838632 RepID=A0A9D2PBG2_9FIRM|nr:MarR family transcriptional regulator [Candidatus Lachnoclostridium pullistercoris]